jgi:hypothetical protein
VCRRISVFLRAVEGRHCALKTHPTTTGPQGVGKQGNAEFGESGGGGEITYGEIYEQGRTSGRRARWVVLQNVPQLRGPELDDEAGEIHYEGHPSAHRPMERRHRRFTAGHESLLPQHHSRGVDASPPGSHHPGWHIHI